MSGDVVCLYEVNGYGVLGDNSTLMDDGKYRSDNSKRRVIVVRSGHGSDGTGVGPLNGQAFFEVTRACIDRGYTVYCINAAGPDSWWNAASTAAVAAAFTHLQSKWGITQWAGFGGSMGGGVLIQALKTLSANCVGLATISAATDLDYAHGTAGYIPAYSMPVGNQLGVWQGECETAYNTNAAGWVTATNGHRIRDEYNSWSGLTIPIKMWHGDSDLVVPIGQGQAFVAGVNNPLVTMEILPGAGHTPWAPGSVGGFGPEFSDYLDFFDSLDWAA